MDRFIPAPADPADWPAWREALHRWRAGQRHLTGFAAGYPEWAGSQYVQSLVMLWDEELWNAADGWRADALLDRAEAEYGGWDQVVLWNNYPLSGVDPRDQYDYFADLPGGLDGLAGCVAAMQRRGVRVLLDHKPWVPGVPRGFVDADRALVHVVERCGFDGIYLDCAAHPKPRLKGHLDALGGDHLFCSEATTPLEHLAYQPWSWCQFTADSDAPGIMRNRWLERRALVYETRRYHHHPIRELHRAWLGGGGHVVWENVFGYWAGYSPRYRSWLRLCSAAQRRFHPLFAGEDWEPLVAGVPGSGIYVSRYAGDGMRLYPVCNRGEGAWRGELVRCPLGADERALDVISGQELTVERAGDEAVISGAIGEEGIAGVLVLPADRIDADLEAFLAAQRTAHAAADFTFVPWEGEHRLTELPHNPVHTPALVAVADEPEDMVRVPAWSGRLRQRYRMRECGFLAGSPSEIHVYDGMESEHVDLAPAEVGDLWVDRTPVTNAAFAAFLAETGYRPREGHRFLDHWVDGRPPIGKESHPVVYVDLADARAYAAWAGKRLPTPAEWQRACLGDRRDRFPWGGELGRDRCNDGGGGDTTAVDRYPRGASAYGCLDMIGNTWEWTECERSDGHTRYTLLKGGCWYGAEGSHWLFDGGPRGGDWAAKLILMHGGWDRCATVGFRCVADRDDGVAVHDAAAAHDSGQDLLGQA